MTATKASNEARDDLALLRKRIKIRAWRRGMREMDILLGGFADARLEALEPADLTAFEALLDVEDDVDFRWFSGAEPVAKAHDTPLFRQILAFHQHERPIH